MMAGMNMVATKRQTEDIFPPRVATGLVVTASPLFASLNTGSLSRTAASAIRNTMKPASATHSKASLNCQIWLLGAMFLMPYSPKAVV